MSPLNHLTVPILERLGLSNVSEKHGVKILLSSQCLNTKHSMRTKLWESVQQKNEFEANIKTCN